MIANEQVLPDGDCERCGALVESATDGAVVLQITDYADALLDDLETVDWPESIKARQRNWIGRSEGAEIDFRIEEWDEDMTVFTTRPDTLFGATFFVLAPEHALVARIESEDVQEYVRHASAKKTEERAAAVQKTGVFTGLHAINPVNGERLPIYVADYVLTDYGTGAIMAVPAHDQRDFDFAQAFDLPMRQVVRPPTASSTRASRMSPTRRARCSSTPASSTACRRPRAAGRSSSSSRSTVAAASPSTTACATGASRASATGAVRSRSSTARPTGSSPCRTTSCRSCSPRSRTTSPKGQPPLAPGEDWVRTTCPKCGGEARRETETMDTFVDSSWYFLRYCDPHNDEAPFDRPPVDYWNPVDLYIGGVDHATMHMIYARFWVKVLNDLGLHRLPRAVRELLLQRLGDAREDEDLEAFGQRPSAPDDVVERYGADAVRLCILFLGPADQDMEWTEEAVEGMSRFVRRLWRVVNDVAGERARRGVRERPARAQGARDDREGHRRRRPALRLQHAGSQR